MRSSNAGLDEVISPAEWRAWTSLGASAFLMAGTLLESGKLFGVIDLGDLERASRMLWWLLVGLAVVVVQLDRRFKARVQRDERDRDIEARSVRFGRGVLAMSVLSVIAVLTVPPLEYRAWASHEAIAHLLVYAIVLGFIAQFAYAVACYRQDRRP